MFLALVACGPTIPDCPEGSYVTAAGTCAEQPDVPGADSFPACELLAAGDALDVDAGCASGAYDDAVYEGINTALGEPGVCEALAGLAFCDWMGGLLGSHFEDDDGDALPDEGAVARGIYLDAGYTGATSEGLGLAISMGCWLDAYGYTDEVEYVTVDEEQTITELYWSSYGLFVDDYADAETGVPDGYVDHLSLFGR